MFNSQLQSYYECKNESGGYGQYRQVADHLSLGEEHSDGVLYKGFFSKLESKKKKLVSELHGGLRLPKESRGFVLYELLQRAWRSVTEDQTLEWADKNYKA